MKGQKKRRSRRISDRLIRETVHFHRALLNLIRGKKGDLGPVLYRLNQLAALLGRREEDRKLGQEFIESLEDITDHLLKLGVIERLPRKVRLRKVMGKQVERFPTGMERVGWELERPRRGEHYCIYLGEGRVFRTGKVEDCDLYHLRTVNSHYEIEVLEVTPNKSH